MKLIYQKQAADCVVAAVATLAGLPYRRVKSLAGSTRHGLDSIWTRWLLAVCDCPHKLSFRKDRLTAQEWAARHPRALALLIVCRLDAAGKVEGHAVVAYGGRVHDPASEPWTDGVVEEVYRLTRRSVVERCGRTA